MTTFIWIKTTAFLFCIFLRVLRLYKIYCFSFYIGPLFVVAPPSQLGVMKERFPLMMAGTPGNSIMR